MAEWIVQTPAIGQVARLVVTTVVAAFAAWFLLWLEKKAVAKLPDHKKKINLRFVESVGRFIVILFTLEIVVMSSPLTESFGRVLFQGTTVIAAIAGFAAQPVIADIICGLMMSASRPFDIGDRIILEDGTTGIVTDISLRQVTLQGIDTQKMIIPNSKLNEMKIINMSYAPQEHSIHFRFNVSYDTDAERAIAVIGKAVEDSPYSIPGKPGKNGEEYGPVYFLEYADSSLVMATTVYYKADIPMETVRSDINRRVKLALEENDIEIPYNYVNVVMSQKAMEE